MGKPLKDSKLELEKEAGGECMTGFTFEKRGFPLENACGGGVGHGPG